MKRSFALSFVALAACRGTPAEPSDSAPATRVHCALAEQAHADDTRSLRGVVAPAPENASIAAPLVAGVLVRIVVREGDVVRKNQLLAEVDARPARALLEEARAHLAQAMASDANDAETRAHEQRLFELGIAARHSADSAAFTQEHSRAGVDAARAAVSVAQQTVGHTAIRALSDGVVVHVLRRVGDIVDGTSATPVVEIADPAHLEFVAEVPLPDLALLPHEGTGVLRLDSVVGRTYPVRLRSVGPAVDPITGLGLARFTLEAPGGGPPLGVLGQVEVVVGSRDDVRRIPASALRNPDADGAEVVLCAGALAEVRHVTVVSRVGDSVFVGRGLAAGERVATDEVVGLEDGAAIEVVR